MTRARDLADSADKDIAGTLTVDDITASGDVTIAGDLTVTGATSGGGGSSGTHTGNVVGNVTGDLTGNVTGNVTGDVTGNVTGSVTATAMSVSGAFASQGIDDNATSTAVTLDASGNLIVGKTSVDNATTAGFEIRSTGYTAIARDGANVLSINRLTSDGSIVNFRKDGATLGSIGSYSGAEIVITGGTTNTSGVVVGDNLFVPCVADGATQDGVTDLGISARRWKDLYLSGGAYLGGTGAANKLDDYEQGAHTFTWNGGGTLSASQNNYVKIGNIVHLAFDISFPANSVGSGCQISIPFTATGSYYSGPVMYHTASGHLHAEINGGIDKLLFRVNQTGGASCADLSSKRIIGFVTYQSG